MSHISYDPTIIRVFAAKLYERARAIIAMATFVGGVVGLGMGAAGGGAADHGGMGALFGLTFGAVIGYAIGQQMAFKLKLEAQIALCQVQIEENTRAAATAHRQMPVPPARPANTNAA